MEYLLILMLGRFEQYSVWWKNVLNTSCKMILLGFEIRVESGDQNY